ncbi:hypothetical protein ASPBRDRAFT_201089 [Aspergillus brasiliensis CBS 101740]|uniref:Amidohydrolase-related domain-containing protein n=1 Tax=Aspergillus brasiliensis (strain CBS 101740 / IMI 381727 / IBT 21946) TaxID=767769 RepID=A0A1L9U477_ASPBC|nr:hypothetical protein ASPBRDRAFT_201089 [Aspergillus brasiliensis CBS 101740]
MPPSASRIDVHHHYLPPIYVQALEAAGGDPSGWKTPEWSLESDRVLCQKHNIRTAILSVTAPGPDIAEGLEAARIARGLTSGQQVSEIRTLNSTASSPRFRLR